MSGEQEQIGDMEEKKGECVWGGELQITAGIKLLRFHSALKARKSEFKLSKRHKNSLACANPEARPPPAVPPPASPAQVPEGWNQDRGAGPRPAAVTCC